MIPKLALVYLPLLFQVQVATWQAAPEPSFLAAQVEKESCKSLAHPKCWDPRSELKTDREYGFGLGQITRAYRADGSVRFDKFSELKAQYTSLRGWTWEKRFDPRLQLIALVEMDKAIYSRISAATAADRVAMALAAYNGGETGLMQDKTVCRATPGCDPDRWYGHVESTSTKSRVKWQGYGKSAFEINRDYPRDIEARRQKYIPYMEKS